MQPFSSGIDNWLWDLQLSFTSWASILSSVKFQVLIKTPSIYWCLFYASEF